MKAKEKVLRISMSDIGTLCESKDRPIICHRRSGMWS
jgi:hypothetical protein